MASHLRPPVRGVPERVTRRCRLGRGQRCCRGEAAARRRRGKAVEFVLVCRCVHACAHRAVCVCPMCSCFPALGKTVCALAYLSPASVHANLPRSDACIRARSAVNDALVLQRRPAANAIVACCACCAPCSVTCHELSCRRPAHKPVVIVGLAWGNAARGHLHTHTHSHDERGRAKGATATIASIRSWHQPYIMAGNRDERDETPS
jgi:hypothetical protein